MLEERPASSTQTMPSKLPSDEGHHGRGDGQDADDEGVEGEAGHGVGSCRERCAVPTSVPHAPYAAPRPGLRPWARPAPAQTSVTRSPACAL